MGIYTPFPLDLPLLHFAVTILLIYITWVYVVSWNVMLHATDVGSRRLDVGR